MSEQTAALSPKQQAFVAAYIGEAKHNATEAARIAGYKQPHSQGPRLLENVGIRAAVDAYLAEIKARGIALKQNRIDAGVDRGRRLQRIVDEREAWFAEHEPEIPGGQSGYLVRRIKRVQHTYEPDPDDDDSRASVEIAEVTEYEFDAALLKRQLENEQQVAQEAGEWMERSEQTLTGAGGAPLTVIIAERPDGPQ